ncbi:MAG: class I SAM-dependent methyltransferase [Nanoarchaeota archaeon]|nr:class I SAM-dependent methyltransferase [Nanoarchaeota archaeon]
MNNNSSKIENEFGKFFYTEQYMKLKNYLFNYRFRKIMVKSAFDEYSANNGLKEEAVLVDIGSGISPITPYPSKTLFLELEKKAVAFLNSQGLNAKKGDITKLPLKKISVDIIFCSEVLEHVPNYKKALSECARVLKKKGALILTVPTHMNYWKDDDDYVGHIRRFNPETLQNDIKQAGLKIKSIKPIGCPIERFLTNLTVKLARKTRGGISSNPLGNYLFYLINTLMLCLIYLGYLFNNKNNSSIILITAVKD